MLSTSKIAERLLANARLCREVAEESSNNVTTKKFERLADECARAAANVLPDRDPNEQMH
jgi:hypothetical protein